MNWPTFDIKNSGCKPIFKHQASRLLGFFILLAIPFYCVVHVLCAVFPEVVAQAKYLWGDVVKLFKYTFFKWSVKND